MSLFSLTTLPRFILKNKDEMRKELGHLKCYPPETLSLSFAFGLDQEDGQYLENFFSQNLTLKLIYLKFLVKLPAMLLQCFENHPTLTSLEIESYIIYWKDLKALKTNVRHLAIYCEFQMKNAFHDDHKTKLAEQDHINKEKEKKEYEDDDDSTFLDRNPYLESFELTLRNAKRLDLNFNFIPQLKTNDTLKTLILKQNQIVDSMGIELAKSLKYNDVLTELDLSENILTLVTLSAFSETLKSNSTLKMLNLASNFFHGAHHQEKGGYQVLANALCQNQTLTYLDICSNLDSTTFVNPFETIFLKMLETNFTLVHLFLFFPCYSNASIKGLLKRNESITLKNQEKFLSLSFIFGDMPNIGRYILNLSSGKLPSKVDFKKT